jgi:SAM-dependent methyltransferase
MSLFEGTYDGWRTNRINKLIQVLGEDYFKGKSVLELACGYGHTGKHLREVLGANLTFAEGDGDFIESIKGNNPDSEVIQLDQDKPWDLEKKFDAIIHWGVLYHLDDWQQDLECALKHTDVIFLESEVADSDDPTYEYKFDDHEGYDQALNTKATRASASFIESVLEKNGFKYTRYDDVDINCENHRYDWVVSNNPSNNTPTSYGLRRFWIAEKL